MSLFSITHFKKFILFYNGVSNTGQTNKSFMLHSELIKQHGALYLKVLQPHVPVQPLEMHKNLDIITPGAASSMTHSHESSFSVLQQQKS